MKKLILTDSEQADLVQLINAAQISGKSAETVVMLKSKVLSAEELPEEDKKEE